MRVNNHDDRPSLAISLILCIITMYGNMGMGMGMSMGIL